MPLLNDLSDEADWVEPDDVPRSVVTYGFVSDAFGNFELKPHRHAKSQILLVQRGALACELEGGLWIVPPRSALWIPGETLHAIKMTGVLPHSGMLPSERYLPHENVPGASSSFSRCLMAT